jgi:hypothetical protein
MNMKTIHLAIAILLAAGSAYAVDPYDYWVGIAQVPDVVTSTAVIKRVVIFVGNRGPFSGPNFDVTLTVKNAAGQNVVCSTGLSTQSPLLKNQQRNVLAFDLSYPKGRPPFDPHKVGQDKYNVFANISTQYPNDDTNAANGTQSKQFTFPSGGTTSCKPMS